MSLNDWAFIPNWHEQNLHVYLNLRVFALIFFLACQVDTAYLARWHNLLQGWGKLCNFTFVF